MALIKFGSVITDSRGSIGGMTFKWGRYGNTMQRIQIPTYRQTPSTTRARSRFGSLSKAWWSELTPTQRTDWRDLAAANPRANTWGDEFPLTGLALFLGVNSTLAQAGYAPLADAPADQNVTGLSTLELSAIGPDTVELTFTPSPVPADHVLYILARANFSPGILNSSRRQKFLLVSAESETSPLDISSGWLSLFGDVITDRQQLVAACFVNVTNGARSSLVTAQEIAT